MTIRHILNGVLALAFGFHVSAYGQGTTAEVSVEWCRLATAEPAIASPTPDQSLFIGYCLGLMEGLRGGNYYLLQAKSKMAFCAPGDVLNEGLAKLFVLYVDKTPDLKDVRASLAAQIAFSRAFPCQ